MKNISATCLLVSVLMFPTALTAETIPMNDSTHDRFTHIADPRVTWGIDISLTSGLNVPSGGGPWIGVGVSRNFRVRFRLIADSYYMNYFYPNGRNDQKVLHFIIVCRDASTIECRCFVGAARVRDVVGIVA